MTRVINDEIKILGIERWKFNFIWMPGVLVILIFFSFLLVIGPRIEEMKQFSSDTASTKKKTIEIDQKRQYLLSADEADLKAKENLVTSALPGRKDVYYLLTVVQNIANQFGYSVDSFSVSPGKFDVGTSGASTEVKKNDALTNIPVKISLVGTQENFLALIEKIESSLPILSIDAFKMTQNMGGVKLDLTVTTFYSSDKFDNKVGNLTLADLVLTKDDLATLNRLGTFQSIGNNYALGATESGKLFVKYDRTDPFSF